MPMSHPGTSQRNRGRSWSDPFLLISKGTNVGQEVVAGVMGWMTVASSVIFYAKLFVGDGEGVDTGAAGEIFLVVAGLSSAAFGAAFNVPFIVAPSVLYAARESGIEMGGHLADQFLANLAAAAFFMLALKLSFVSFIPTALRLGAGCGVSMLVSVLGLRSLGLLDSNSFTLQPFTWQSIVGLGVVTASCAKLSNPANVSTKWLIVVGVPMLVTEMVYAVANRSKFQGYSSAGHTPLSDWGNGSWGALDFKQIWDDFGTQHWYYIIRTFFSIIINISSILLVLIDAVCLEEVHRKFRSSKEVDFSNAIGGTKKFRLMACAIPLMSCIGTLAGATAQAAFVQSMIVVFAGGRTGLSAVVTGVMLVLSSALWPLLPVLAPSHIAGGLTVVISLRFFTVIRMIDVKRPSNLLMFGLSILLIPFSFDFVNALCTATVLGFLGGNSERLVLLLCSGRNGAGGNNKVAVSETADQGSRVRLTKETESETDLFTNTARIVLDPRTQRDTYSTSWWRSSSVSRKKCDKVFVASDAAGADESKMATIRDCEARLPNKETRTPAGGAGVKRGVSLNVSKPTPVSMDTADLVRGSRAVTSPTEERDLLEKGERRQKPHLLPPLEKKQGLQEHGSGGSLLCATSPAISTPGLPSTNVTSAGATSLYVSRGDTALTAAKRAGPDTVHWGLALAAGVQLLLSAINDRTQDSADE